MEVKSGDIIFVNHYASLNAIKSIVDEQEGNTLVVSPVKRFPVLIYCEGDPVTFKYNSTDKVVIVSCNISEINNQQIYLKLMFENINIDDDSRVNQLFPVSFYAYINSTGQGEKNLVIVKNISLDGMLIYSRENMQVNKEFNIDLHIGKEVVFLSCIIVRKNPGNPYNEYGVLVTYNSHKVFNAVKKFFDNI